MQNPSTHTLVYKDPLACVMYVEHSKREANLLAGKGQLEYEYNSEEYRQAGKNSNSPLIPGWRSLGQKAAVKGKKRKLGEGRRQCEHNGACKA